MFALPINLFGQTKNARCNQERWSSGNAHRHMLRREPFQICAGIPARVSTICCRFFSARPSNTNFLHRIGHDRILPSPLQFITHHTPKIDGIQSKTQYLLNNKLGTPLFLQCCTFCLISLLTFVIYMSVRVVRISPLFEGRKQAVFRTSQRYVGNNGRSCYQGQYFFVQILRVLRINTATGSNAIFGRYLCNYLVSVTFHPERVLRVNENKNTI